MTAQESLEEIRERHTPDGKCPECMGGMDPVIGCEGVELLALLDDRDRELAAARIETDRLRAILEQVRVELDRRENRDARSIVNYSGDDLLRFVALHLSVTESNEPQGAARRSP